MRDSDEIIMALKPRKDCANCFGRGWYSNISAGGAPIQEGRIASKEPRVCWCVKITGIDTGEEGATDSES